MPNENETKALSAVANILMGQSPNGKTYNTQGKGVPLLNGPTEFGADHPTSCLWTTEPTKICEKGDLLFCVRGTTTGRMNWADQEYCLGRGLCAIRAKTGSIDTFYVYYSLVNELSRLLSLCSGSVFLNLSRKDIENFEIRWLPNPKARAKVVSMLKAIDDKINLNETSNQTLESIGQAVFKRWFVDFEFPNEEGKPYKSSGGEMDSSDFGEVPHGWNIAPFSEVIAVNPLRKIAKNSITTKVEMPDLNPWQPWIESWSKDDYKSGSRFQNGDTLFARITPCLENGKTALVSFLNEKEVAFGSTEFIVLGPKTIWSSHYILCLAISKELRESAILSMTGSSGRQRVPNDFFDNFVVAVPPDELIRKFDSLVAPMFEKITSNARESRSLKAIRDILLPRLMSGKIRVPFSEEEVEAN